MNHYEVVAAVIVHQGRVLCMQRGQTKYDYTSHKWEFPGGKIEPKETPQEAIHREIQEEMGMDIKVGRHLITVEHQYPDFFIRLQCFLCSTGSPDFELREHADFRWLRPEELDQLDWAEADGKVYETVVVTMRDNGL